MKTMIKKSLLGGLLLSAAMTATMFFTLCGSASAKPITREQARQRAAVFMQERHDTRRLTPVDMQLKQGPRRLVAGQAVEQYYVFDRGTSEGFVIVCGDDVAAESILGYCDSGSFDYEQLPPNMREWLDDYAQQIQRLQSQPEQQGQSVHRVPTHPAVAALMSSKWDQGSPYNDACPQYFSLGRSVTGCVATAYAQILYYQREKMVAETQAAMPSYNTYTEHPTYGTLFVQGIPKGSPIDWENMRDTYGSGATAVQKKAVADLMHYCGVGVKMDYTNSASGAQSYEVYNALRQYFGFGSNVRYVSYQNVSSDDQWDELAYAEISEGRPFYISGSNSEAGHAFVCDGYDGNRRYHINWGWGGQSDGYYYLSNLTPGQQGIGGSSDGYNAYRECIMGIEPENYADKALSFADATAKRLCTEFYDLNGDGVLTYGEAAQVTELGSMLTGSAIKTFTELHYFTGLTKIDDGAFAGCEQLTTIQLPKQLKAIGQHAFQNCTSLRSINLPEELEEIGSQAFSNCRSLEGVELPRKLTALEDEVFMDCSSLAELTLPIGIKHLGRAALYGCVGIKDLYLKTMQPEQMELGQGVFAGTCEVATLHIMQGTRSYYEQDDQWQQFASIKEERELSRGQFAPFETGKTYYLYHVGTGRYLTKGEAWGTQAIVGTDNPMRFVAGRTNSMPEGTYYLTSEDTERSGHYLFRTNTDSNVGQGVQAAFVDGSGLTNTAHWTITDVGNNVYTLSIPSGYANYNANRRWGVQNDHASNAASPTWGVYSDVVYEDHEPMCQWRLVAYDAELTANYEAAVMLQNLIAIAVAKHLNVQSEQAVLDNLDSTTDELLQAQRSLRKKLKLLDFADPEVRKACIASFDVDADDELSLTEASQVTDLGQLFQSTTITSFDELQHFTSLKYITGSCFNGCRQLTSIVLPESIEQIYYYAFRNCTKLESINLPEYVSSIGNAAFDGCTALKTVTVLCPDPDAISVSANAFSRVSLKDATLQVPAGSKALYEQAAVWKEFGNITEVRARTQPRFSPIAEGAVGYVYNVATRKFLSKGEAYGTQSVVAQRGMRYTWMRTKSMADGQYYLYSSETGQNGKILFRTNTDTKVGEGVKACFVDGSLSTRAYWTVDSVAELTYTLQVPATDASYVAGEYLGTDYYHQSSAASPTSGTYWDSAMTNGHEKQAQWRFVSVEDMEAALQADANIDELKTLLLTCEEKNIDKTAEQAVYDNLQSSAEEIEAAILSLREKLHYINFSDSRAKTICLEEWDQDADGELTYEEAACVTSIGEIFRNQTLLKNLEALRYFTALEEIPENAFRNSSELTTIYLPSRVASVGKSAFLGCSSLKYIVVMNAETMVTTSNSNISNTATVFVPQKLLDGYLSDEKWQTCNVTPFTGTPVVHALPGSRIYGRTIALLKYEVKGAPIDGEPVLSCDELGVATTPVGTYVIHVAPGTITSRGLICEEGELSVTPAPLTITAQSYTRGQGEPNPAFEVTYKGWRNRETADVLLTQPMVSCAATQDSPAGQYDIVVSGAEAQNYEITYVNGVLTITGGTNAIRQLATDDGREVLYDLQGRRISKPNKKGIYVTGNKRKTVRR